MASVSEGVLIRDKPSRLILASNHLSSSLFFIFSLSSSLAILFDPLFFFIYFHPWRSVYDHVDVSVYGHVPLTLLSDGVMKLEMITIRARHKTK